MKIFYLPICLLGLCASAFSAAKENSSPSETAGRFLDQWHEAAAGHSEERYFEAMTEDFVFLGTDPGERWTKEEFRAYAHPVFAKGKGWEIKKVKRKLFFSQDGKTAWFDEDAMSKELGPVRGSGVLVKDGSKWKVAQYNLSVPIPNDKFKEARALFEKKK